MSPRPTPQEIRLFVAAADRGRTVTALGNGATTVAAHLRWIAPGNPLEHDAVRSLAGSGDDDRCAYISASALLHVLDGWRYLARAANALCMGDPNAAIHLAYYAELRAGMAVLAAEGIGVFDRAHYCITANGTLRLQGELGTHPAVWALLRAWADVPGSATRALNSLWFGGCTLADWTSWAIRGGGGTLASSDLAATWIRAWSLDIKELGQDRFRRNEASYRPSGMIGLPAADASAEATATLVNAWSALAPSGGEGGVELDGELLFLALERVRGGREWPELLDNVSAAAETDGAAVPSYSRAWLESRVGEPEHWLIDTASDSQSSSAAPILSRAALLLRLASAMTRQVALDAQWSGSDLRQWWSAVGVHSGFVRSPGDWDDPPTLYDEVAAAVDQIDSPSSIADLLDRARYPVYQLDRVGAWLTQVA